MNYEQLARKLLAAHRSEVERIIGAHLDQCGEPLAAALRNICYEVWTSEPHQVEKIAQILRRLNAETGDPIFAAYAEWTEAVANLVGGNLKESVRLLELSEKSFNRLGNRHAAATTQISKLYALGLLGEYDRAVSCGLEAREIFLAHGDVFSAAKIEHNIGNLYWRRDLYAESEPYLESAHAHFAEVGDQRQLALVENSLAFAKSLQNEFRRAEEIYQTAMQRAAANAFTVTQAEIEIGLSSLYLFQAQYDQALDFLERARRLYETLEMPHQSATCRLEIADIYFELNLLPEAAELYDRAAGEFEKLEMRRELARARLNRGRIFRRANDETQAQQMFLEAESLFAAEGSRVAAATARLYRAKTANADERARTADSCLQIFASGAYVRGEILARLMLGETALDAGEVAECRRQFDAALRVSETNLSPLETDCLTALGTLALVQNDTASAEKWFGRAAAATERVRARIGFGEYRTAFFAGRLTAFYELARLALKRGDLPETLRRIARFRARSLFETDAEYEKPDAPKTAIALELRRSRENLNWFYSRLNRENAGKLEAGTDANKLRRELAAEERHYAELVRRARAGGAQFADSHADFDVAQLQKNLNGAIYIEYAFFDGQLAAFVVDEKNISFFGNLIGETELNDHIKRFLFQIKTGRFAARLSEENRRVAAERLDRLAAAIYEAIFRPLEPAVNARRIAVAPAGHLFYLPFQALKNANEYLVERYEFVYAPGAAFHLKSLKTEKTPDDSILLIGSGDQFTPLVEAEIAEIGRLFEKKTLLTGTDAEIAALKTALPAAAIVHFACHADFRPDNPLFSSLSLTGEKLLVRDLLKMNFGGKTVILSACETGLGKIIGGEEIIGLTGGFLSSGADSLVMSLWTVDDAETFHLMKGFYQSLRAGMNPAAALRRSQLERLAENPHPYFWSAFVCAGK